MASVAERVLPLEVVTELLSEVLIKENVIDPVYEINSGFQKGDGYTSSITKVNVKGKNKVLPLIIKSALNTSSLRNLLPIRVEFIQEIKYYEELLPAFKKFQNEKGIKEPFNSFPICYKTLSSENGEVLIMEDIKAKGFKAFDKKKQMDEAHVEMVLRTYGRLHAVSFSMKDHDRKRFEELTKNIERPFSIPHLKEDFFDMFLLGSDRMKSLFDEDAEPGVFKKVSSLKANVMPFFESLDNYDGKHSVITHGDCWCNNMMFKYDGENSSPPTDMRLFDFQLGTLTTPIFDLAYFFYASASQEMLNNLDYYLKVYHDSLRKNMLEMGSDVDKWFPFSGLKEEWQKYGKFGLYISMCVYRVMLRDEDEILDLTDSTVILDTFMKNSKNDDLINEKYRRIALHFYNNKLI